MVSRVLVLPKWQTGNTAGNGLKARKVNKFGPFQRLLPCYRCYTRKSRGGGMLAMSEGRRGVSAQLVKHQFSSVTALILFLGNTGNKVTIKKTIGV